MTTERIKVLFVDDRDERRCAILRLLQDNGYDVVAAPSKVTALGFLGHWIPDVILTNLDMSPEIDGFKQIKQPNTKRSKTKLFLVRPDRIADQTTLAKKFGV